MNEEFLRGLAFDSLVGYINDYFLFDPMDNHTLMRADEICRDWCRANYIGARVLCSFTENPNQIKMVLRFNSERDEMLYLLRWA